MRIKNGSYTTQDILVLLKLIARGRVGVPTAHAEPPLYKAAPSAIKADPKHYELLVLVDEIRGGRARERNYAINEMKKG